MAYQISPDCIGCMLCHRGCPQGAIFGEKKQRQTIDASLCIECGYCANVCGFGAIRDEQGQSLSRIPKKEWPKPIIDRATCVGCSVCVQNCPGNCLEIESAKYHGDIQTIAILARSDQCIGCKICQSVCPIHAISFPNDLPEKEKWNMGKVYCRIYQGVLKIGMYFIPWGVPQTIEGPGSVRRLPALIQSKGIQKVLVVTDEVLHRQLHMLDGLFDEMAALGLQYVVYDGVQPNPTDRNLQEGAKLFREHDCEAMIAFGGGSPMDCAKGIGAMIARPKKTLAQLHGLFRVLRRIPAIFAVPTTSGTGSETTVAAVITDSQTHHKASLNDTCLMPKYAILDPELTKGLPKKVTSTTGMDAMCHAVEAFTNRTYNTRLENEYAMEAVRLIYNNLLTCCEEPENSDARMNMMLAAFKAGRAFTRGCVGYVHAIGHTLGGLYGTPHGLAMAVILPHVMRQFGPAVHERLARLAEVCGYREGDDAQKADWFLTWIEELERAMDIPRHLDNIRDEDYDRIIEWAMKEANPLYPVPVIWEKADFIKCLDTIRGKI